MRRTEDNHLGEMESLMTGTVNITIDGQGATVPSGTLLIDACAKIGITIPAMCYVKEYGHFTSCMVCVVRNVDTDRMIPSCSAQVEEGMRIDTRSPAVIDSRRMALELLLSDHVGDCEGPCTRGCPAGLDVPAMIRCLADGRIDEAARIVREGLPIPAVLGRICPAPCEKTCRRAQIDQAVAIRYLARCAAEHDGGKSQIEPDTGKRVAVIGAGVVGLSASCYLRVKGHVCEIYEQGDKPGGGLLDHVAKGELPENVLEQDIDGLLELGIVIKCGIHVGRDTTVSELSGQYDAVLIASSELVGKGCGENVFGGDYKMRTVIHAVGEGKRLANLVGSYLETGKANETWRRFNSTIGRLHDAEKDLFLAQAEPVGRIDPGVEDIAPTPGQVRDESRRCLHCDCRKADACRLRDYSDRCNALQREFKAAERRTYEQNVEHPEIVFEQGKCILCGLCVRITEKRGIEPGLSFVNRGMDTGIAVPFGGNMSDGLGSAAEECVRRCPTGALAFREGAGQEKQTSNAQYPTSM